MENTAANPATALLRDRLENKVVNVILALDDKISPDESSSTRESRIEKLLAIDGEVLKSVVQLVAEISRESIAKEVLDLDHDTLPPLPPNLCMICNEDLGSENPRQLCRKTYCENGFYAPKKRVREAVLELGVGRCLDFDREGGGEGGECDESAKRACLEKEN